MTYGKNAHVGNLTVFSHEGAIKAYKIFIKLFNNNMTIETCTVLQDAAQDMHSLGFTDGELELLEAETV